MGRGGTDVAREAVERVICDGNIRKVIYPLPSTDTAEWDAAGRLLQAGDPKSHRAGLAGRQTQIIVWHARNNRISRSQVHARF